MKGLFGDLFDYDHDGDLDPIEQATEFEAFMNLMDEENKRKASDSDMDEDEDDTEFMDEDDLDLFDENDIESLDEDEE